MGVAGVAIGTIVSQCISCILVLRCLYRSEGSYQLRFSKLTIKSFYLKQIFQVGIPAGNSEYRHQPVKCFIAIFCELFWFDLQWQDILQQIIFWISVCICKLCYTILYELYQSELWSTENKTYGQSAS